MTKPIRSKYSACSTASEISWSYASARKPQSANRATSMQATSVHPSPPVEVGFGDPTHPSKRFQLTTNNSSLNLAARIRATLRIQPPPPQPVRGAFLLKHFQLKRSVFILGDTL